MAIHRGNCGRSLMTCIALCLSLMATVVDGAKPAAISAPVRTKWLGNDGSWSPVSLMVGTPAQWIDVFVSTASQETWVVGQGGCDGTVLCQNKRGGLFLPNESSTWNKLGVYDLGLDPQLGIGGYGSYGLETVGLTDTLSAPSQVLGVINTTDYWVGYLGLGIKPSNFTDVNQPTFLSSLVENRSVIPSHSYGYTAGAFYRLKSVPASLTLGGYDANRFESHGISFDLDPGQNPVVALNQISVTAAPLASSNVSLNWPSNSIELLGANNDGLFTIDSSTPYLWLPESVCLQFERALGLKYDENLQLYTIGENNTQHKTLVGWNMTFRFVLADLPGSSNLVSLSLPYEAFDLQLTYPFPGLNATESSGPTNYFPLRKAANSTQYTIGRAFLQETYLIVDYERNNFSISQAVFDANAVNNKDLIDISRPSNSTFGGPDIPQGNVLSKAAIAGLVFGSMMFLILASLAGLCIRRRQRSRVVNKHEAPRALGSNSSLSRYRFWRRLFDIPERIRPCEIDGCKQQPHEASSESEIKELPANAHVELPGSKVDAGPCEETRRKLTINIVNARGYDPNKPVELHDQCSPGELPDDRSPDLRHVVSPPYPPSHVGSHTTQTSGIGGRRQGVSPGSSQVSSPGIISPLTPAFAHPISGNPGWGYTNDDRRHRDGSHGDACSENTHEGVGGSSDEEHQAQYPECGSPSHKFSWEEQ